MKNHETQNSTFPKKLLTIKADRQPIANFIKEQPFTLKEIQLEKNDIIYSFSDGYVDQFGGKNGVKFKTKKFKELLLSIADKDLNKQKEILEKTFFE